MARACVEVNSARRRERIVKEIAKRFGKTARLVETNVTDVMKELETRRAGGAELDESATSPSSARERTPELLADFVRTAERSHRGSGRMSKRCGGGWP